MYRLASCHEEIIFERIEKNVQDPGCRLTYAFLIHGELVVDEMEGALRALMLNFYHVALCKFVRKGGGLYVYSSGMPENVLDYKERPESLHCLNGPMAPLPENRLFLFTLTKLSEHVHHLRLTFSHLIFDGQCYRIFCNFLNRTYRKERARLNTLIVSQRTRHRRYCAPVVPSVDTVAFWKERLIQYPLGQRLSFLKTHSRGTSPFVTVRRSVTGSSYADLQAFVTASNSTLFRLIVAATAITIARYSNDQDLEGLCIAHTLDTRQQPGVPGCFTSLVPLWIEHHADWSPRQYLSHVDQQRRAVRPHQHLAPQRLLEFADERLNRNRPVLNVVVNQSEGLLPSVCPELEGLKVELIETPSTGGPYDLGVNFHHDAKGLSLSVDIPRSLATDALVNQWADNLMLVVNRFVSDGDTATRAIEFAQPLRPAACGDAMALTKADSVVARFHQRSILRQPSCACPAGAGRSRWAVGRSIGGAQCGAWQRKPAVPSASGCHGFDS